MKFLYLVTCCMILSSHNFYAASEIDSQSSRLESDWFTTDKEGNSEEIEKKIIPTISTTSENNEPNVHETNNANEIPDQKIIKDIDEIVDSIYTTCSSIYINIFNMFTDDDDNDI